jgi:hypothetical protein
MASISEEEKARRRRVNASVIGTNAMEGLELDSETLTMMHLFEEGKMTRKQLSAAIDGHVAEMLAARRNQSRKATAVGAA